MTHELHIRAATQDDLPGLLELYRQLHPEDPHLSLEPALQIWRQFTHYKGNEVFVGFVESKLVTTCTLVVVPNLTRGGSSYALIENVVTGSLYRKQGFGHAILRTAIAQAWTLNCYKVMLLTGSKNPDTIRFYYQTGFEQSKTGFQIRKPET